MELKTLHKRCEKIFRERLFEEEENEASLGRSNACKVYDALAGDCFERDDCIGENFNQLLHRIAEEWFGNYQPKQNADYYFCNYILLLYLVVERVDQIFDVINKDGKSKLFNDFHYMNFQSLRRINKWANFFKHPKEFLFTHWPTYFFASERPNIDTDDIVIDYEFIEKHYFSEKCPRPVMLENNNRVFVEIPDLEVLTKEFCDEMNTFFNFICANQLIADFLQRKSTIELIYDTQKSDVADDGIETNVGG